MCAIKTFSAFISYTATDLSGHADIVSSVLRKLRIVPIDHRDSGSTGEPSVAWCMEQIKNADILIVIVAHRYGWIPSRADGGDGSKSITWLEVQRAHKLNKIVLSYLVDEGASWPVDLIEGLGNPDILPLLRAFKEEIRKNVTAFFFDPSSLDGPVSRDVPNALKKLSKKLAPSSIFSAPNDSNYLEEVLPWLYDPVSPPTMMERMRSDTPKRILCLEGNTWDCFVTIGYLEKLEKQLQVRYNDSDFRISDYYDLIVGNGLNSFLAVELAMGKKMQDILPLFEQIMDSYFSDKMPFYKQLYHRYNPVPLRKILKRIYGQDTIASDNFKTGIALIVTRFDQSIPWHFINHEQWEHLDPLSRIGLDRLLESCSAIPSYMPYVILNTPNLGEIVVGDGGFAAGNDNSLYALMLVTNHQYPYKWRLGRNRLSLTTIGSKGKSVSIDPYEFKNTNLLLQMPILIDTLLAGSAANSEALLNGLAGNETAGISQTPILTNVRYDMAISHDSLAKLGLNVRYDDFAKLFIGMSADSMELFLRVGRIAGDKQIHLSDFNASFDVREQKMD